MNVPYPANDNWYPGKPMTSPFETQPVGEPLQAAGIMSDWLMYSDFKVLLKRSAISRFVEIVIERLEALEDANQPLGSDEPVSFSIDAFEHVLDEVSKELRDDNKV